ncbi:MAG: HlyD family type I secretion periplasmic adaptor subunit [Pseudomonadota bacterium]
MMAPPPRTPRTGLKRAGIVAVLASLALFGGLIAWSVITQISGAVIATGTVVTDGNTRSIQHIDGGIVSEILVENGDRVGQGDVLIRLEDTLLRANAEIYRTRLSDALAQRSRLRAEQLGLPKPEPATSDLIEPARLAESHLGELEIFAARQSMQAGRVEQLEERIRQFRNQIVGVDGLLASKQEQLTFVGQELAASVSLNERGLAIDSQVLGLQRSRSDLLGQVAEHISERARIENSIRDAELEILQIARQFREQVVSDIQEVDNTVQELIQQLVSTDRQLARTEIRAPDSGIVHELQIFTIGGVIPPGGTIVQIVPTEEAMTFDMRIDPSAIDQVYPGQTARVRFPAFDARTTPELAARVAGVSPTTVVDEATGMSYFRAELSIGTEELARLGEVILLPGMPVEGYLQTTERSVISYLMRPITDQFVRAFREE